jgi:hypothetical protein
MLDLTEIVLILITKNSHRNLGNTYKRTLESSLRAPYNSILMVDSGEDDTLKVTLEFCHENNKLFIELLGYMNLT